MKESKHVSWRYQILFLSFLIATHCLPLDALSCHRLAEEEEVLECDNGERYLIEEERAQGFVMFVYILTSMGLVVFAGLMSGLTLGLLSLDLMDLQILESSGDDKQRKYAKKIIPLIKRHHLLLVTLLLANAAAMEALPIVLDRLTSPGIAIVVSVTCVLLFGEVIPQAICSRYGLTIGAFCAWPVWILMMITFPISWPISKVLDYALSHNAIPMYKRTELKQLVTFHGEDHAGPLTKDEMTIIKGALDMKEKTVHSVMTRFDSVFMVEYNTKLDKQTMVEIMQTGHSRIPVYEGSRHNIKGLLLVKSLMMVDPDDEVPVSSLRIRPVPSVSPNLPLYDMLNDFQTGKSHIALVAHPTRGEILGIITLEDVVEELIQEEIVDETDVYVDVERRIRVARIMRTLSKPTVKNSESSIALSNISIADDPSSTLDSTSPQLEYDDGTNDYTIPLIESSTENHSS